MDSFDNFKAPPRFPILRWLSTIAVLSLSLLMSAQAGASSVDREARDLLIKKLNRVYLNLNEKDPAHSGVSLRLADLLAERARQLSMQELDRGCGPCLAGQDDRERALQLYRSSLSRLDGRSKDRVLLQMGHLLELGGQPEEARALYQKIADDEGDPGMVGEAHFCLAEMDYRSGKFAQAIPHYQKVLDQKGASQRGLAAYRKAWSQFNLSEIDAAISSLMLVLRNPELLRRTASQVSGAVDPQFQQEVAHDLAIFLAKAPFEENRVSELIALSAPQFQSDNAQYLAVELERIGKTSEAINVWRVVQGLETNAPKRVEGDLRMAYLYLAVGERGQSLERFSQALSGYPALDECQSTTCQDLGKRMRAFIIDLHKGEKNEPSAELAKLYAQYTKVFPGDYEMLMWAGGVNEQRQSWLLALDFYEQAVRIALNPPPDKPVQQAPKAAPALPNLNLGWEQKLEVALLAKINAAEKSGDGQKLLASYQHYIEESKLQQRYFEVLYQRAHTYNAQGQWELANRELQQLAMNAQADTKVRVMAMELYLDNLALQKRHSELEATAKALATAFPNRKQELDKFARQAIFNQAADLVPTDKSGLNTVSTNLVRLSEAWTVLSRFDEQGASREELELLYRNRLLLAERLEKFDEARRAADELLTLAERGSENFRLALRRKAWLAELTLDFPGALRAQNELSSLANPPEAHWLNMALLAELAGQDPSVYYEQYLKTKPQMKEAAAVIERLFMAGKGVKAREAILTRHFPVLREQSETYGRLAIKQLGASLDYQRAAKRFQEVPSLGDAPSGKVLRRYIILKEWAPIFKELSQHKLNASNDRQLTKSLDQRIRTLNRAEDRVQAALRAGDWTLQVVCLAQIGQEYSRLYEEIMALPVPSGLSSEQEQEYLQLLSTQAGPYQIKAQDVTAKMKQLWQSSDVLAVYQDAFARADAHERTLLKLELEAVGSVTDSARREALLALTRSSHPSAPAPSLAELESARALVRQRPFDLPALERLKGLETQLGRRAMVDYLQSRMAQAGARSEGQNAAGYVDTTSINEGGENATSL